MLDIKYIRENLEKVKDGISAKQYDPKVVDELLTVDEKKRALLLEIEKLRQERNRLGKDLTRGRQIKDKLKTLEPEWEKLDVEYEKLLLSIPNLPVSDVLVGKDESENQVVRSWGEVKKISAKGGPTSGWDFQPRDHIELGENLDIIDIKRAAKVSGTRFNYLKNEAAILEFALVQLAFETLTKEGFVPVVPPVMISEEAMRAMGYLEHGGGEETYFFPKDKMYLVGTSEQSVGPMHMNEIFAEKDLPKRYVAFSTCFRREAGSYGKDTRGILRVHQFDKVEMFSYALPEDSDKEHEYLLSLEEKIVQSLDIPYQVVKMCTGDLGFPAARKYDIECWIPSQDRCRETHSTSTCTDFQARRLNIKYRTKDGKVNYVHTLNGTAVAIGRMLIAILENYQQKDGSVLIPKILQKYTGFEKILPKNHEN